MATDSTSTTDTGDDPAAATRIAVTDQWAQELAGRLFGTPARWGWQAAAEPVVAAPSGVDLHSPPPWTPPPRPDTNHLQRALNAARRQLRAGLALWLLTAIALAFGYHKMTQLFDRSVIHAYLIASAVILVLFLINVFGKVGPYLIAARTLREYLGPYDAAVARDRERYDRLVMQWSDTVRQYEQRKVETDARRAGDPEWLPVVPRSEPARVDVVGGDPARHGWAGLLITLGASVLAAGRRITVLDLSGRQVGNGLISVAQARGLPTTSLRLPADLAGIDLFAGLAPADIAECLAHALTDQHEKNNLRYERSFTRDVIDLTVRCLDRPATFARLAAAVEVLRQAGDPGDVLTVAEVNRLADCLGRFGSDELAVKQLRLLGSQLRNLAELSPHTGEVSAALFTDAAVTLIATGGGRHDRKDLLDRTVTQLTQHRLSRSGSSRDFLVVAGADELGAIALEALSEHAQQAGVQLLLMLAQPRGDVARIIGTGGAVCFMKSHNPQDATFAAEFIGRDHRFVVSQVTRQAGSSFSDGGGDEFSAETNRGSDAEAGAVRERGQQTQLTESRAHTWAGTRDYSLTQNVSESTTTSRTYEFTVEPKQLFDMPPTAFILIDNTGAGRRIVMADSNPGICLRDRVALAPAPED